MPFLALIPLPYRILLGAILIAAFGGFCFFKGASYEEGKHAKLALEQLKEAVDTHNEAQRVQLAKAIEGLDRLQKLDSKMSNLKSAVEKDIAAKPVFQNKDCALDSGSLKLWNGGRQ